MTTTGRRVRPQSSPDVAPSSLARKHLLSAGVALLAAAPLASRAKDFGCTEGEDDYFCLDGKLRAQNGLPAYQAPPKAKVDGAAAKERRLEAMRAQYRGARAGRASAPLSHIFTSLRFYTSRHHSHQTNRAPPQVPHPSP